MAFETFAALVGLLAVVYAFIARFIQSKLVDRSEMEAIQADSKRLSKEFEEAKKSGDKKKMDEVMKKQMEFLPRMNKMMFSQFKPMLVILVFFFAFTWGVSQLNPFVKDDITIPMADDGTGCDATAGDGTYSACYSIGGTNNGKWVFSARIFDGDNELGSNSTYFLYNADETSDTFIEAPKGEPLAVSTDKASYYEGDTVELYAKSGKAGRVEATLDNGTSFHVDLPLSIPLINVKRIQQPYWWFILVSLIVNLSLSFIMGRLRKRKKK